MDDESSFPVLNCCWWSLVVMLTLGLLGVLAVVWANGHA
jgi:hypothetical protein